MAAPTLAQVIASAGELSALPDSWQRIDAVLAHSAATTAQIADTLASDPILSARLLKMANSPMFGLAQRVEKLSQAVHLIGTRQLRELALAAIVVDLVAGSSGRRERITAFLRHSTATGLYARAVASRRREANVERFFVAGLLHDMGGFALELAASDQVAEAHRLSVAKNLPIEQAEHVILGYDHAAVGGAILTGWRLPASLSESATWHHNPSNAPTHRVEAAVIHLASLAIGLLGITGEGTANTPLDQRAWELLGLAPEDLAPIATETESTLDPMLEILTGTGT
jgi:HD-like signal output (HDOD) protein